MLTMKPSEIAPSTNACQHLVRPQQTDDRIDQRDRAQRKFLALVDVVLDEDAARIALRLGFSERLGSYATIHDITISSAQDTRNATKTHIPRDERSK